MKTKQKHFTDERKEYYRLWYDYLKENPDYKAFCEWMREKREAVKKGKQGPPWTFKWPKKSMEGKQHPAIITFLKWHDIHKYSFEEWWKWRTDAEIKSEIEGLQYSPAPVEECSMWLKRSIDQLINLFKKDQGRDPTAYELRDKLAHHMEKGSYGGWCLYLQISLSPHHSFSEVEEHFKKIVKPKMLKCKVPMFPDFSTKPELPPLDNLKKYLFVHDLKKKNYKNKEIIKDFAEKFSIKSWEGKETDINITRTVKSHHTKARRIITNALYNVFPGQYDFKSEKDYLIWLRSTIRNQFQEGIS